MEHVPIGAPHFVLAVLCGAINAGSAAALLGSGLVLPQVAASYGVPPVMAAWVVVVTLVGAAGGAVLAPACADGAGRRGLVVAAGGLGIGAALLHAAASDGSGKFLGLLTLRFVIGFVVGALGGVPETLLRECLSGFHTPPMVFLCGIGASAGRLYVLCVALATGSHQLILASPALPWAIGVLLLGAFSSESPCWLHRAGYEVDAREAYLDLGGPVSAWQVSWQGPSRSEMGELWKRLSGPTFMRIATFCCLGFWLLGAAAAAVTAGPELLRLQSPRKSHDFAFLIMCELLCLLVAFPIATLCSMTFPLRKQIQAQSVLASSALICWWLWRRSLTPALAAFAVAWATLLTIGPSVYLMAITVPPRAAHASASVAGIGGRLGGLVLASLALLILISPQTTTVPAQSILVSAAALGCTASWLPMPEDRTEEKALVQA